MAVGLVSWPSAPAHAGRACPVTLPQGTGLYGSYGNGDLSVGLPTDGTFDAVDFIRASGTIDIKFPWQRHVAGDLRIRATRIDAPAPPGRPRIPCCYGSIGFQASGIVFPSVGCWQVTGTAGSAAPLTIVVLILGSAPAPHARLLPPRVRGSAATLRWNAAAEAETFDLALRRAGVWRRVLWFSDRTIYAIRGHSGERLAARVRARNIFGEGGPWSASQPFTLR